MGVVTESDATFQNMAENIKLITGKHLTVAEQIVQQMWKTPYTFTWNNKVADAFIFSSASVYDGSPFVNKDGIELPIIYEPGNITYNPGDSTYSNSMRIKSSKNTDGTWNISVTVNYNQAGSITATAMVWGFALLIE